MQYLNQSYLLGASFCMLVCWLFFQIFLRRGTHFSLNRHFLTGSLLLSLLLPVFHVTLNLEPEKEAPVPDWVLLLIPEQGIEVSAPTTVETYAISDWLWWIYVLGVAIAAWLLLRRLFLLAKLISQYPRERQAFYTIVFVPPSMPVFSFAHYLFWNGDHAMFSPDADRIIQHELAHIKGRHSADLLLVELLSVVFWFNPVVYAYGKALRCHHEFIADYEATRFTQSRQYVQLIAREQLMRSRLLLTHSFYSSFKETQLRIRMLNQKKTPKRLVLLRTMLTLPVVALLALAISCSKTTINPEAIESAMVKEMPAENNSGGVDGEIFTVVEKTAVPEGGMEELYKYITKTMRYPSEARREGISGKVYVQFTVTKQGKLSNISVVKGVHPSLDEEALSVLNNSPVVWIPGEHKGIKVNQRIVMPIVFSLDKSQAKDISSLVHVTDKMIAMPVEIEDNAEVFTKVEQTATPVEGMESYHKWIVANINYPQQARTRGEEGKVFVHFIVQKDGSLDDVKIIKGVSPEVDAEALRIIKEHPQKWNAGEHNGLKVKQRIVMPITFSLGESSKGMLDNQIRIKAIESPRKDVQGTGANGVTVLAH